MHKSHLLYPKISKRVAMNNVAGDITEINSRSAWMARWYRQGLPFILLWLIILLPGCNPTPALDDYENQEVGIRLEKPVSWEAYYYNRNGQILLEARSDLRGKRGPLVEIHGKSCLSGSSSDRQDLQIDIDRVRNLYNLDSISVIQEPTEIRTGEYEVSKAVIEIPIAKMQGDDDRIRIENAGSDGMQTIEFYALWSQGRDIRVLIYMSDDEAMNVQAQEIVESIQFTCNELP